MVDLQPYWQSPIVVVDIDDESLRRYGQWPWPRNLVAELVNRTYYSLATGFDIVFAEPDRTGAKQLKKTYQSMNCTTLVNICTRINYSKIVFKKK